MSASICSSLAQHASERCRTSYCWLACFVSRRSVLSPMIPDCWASVRLCLCQRPLNMAPGRDRHNRPIAAHEHVLREAVQRQSSFAIILGPSRSGKSSVVFAGLFPRLRKEPAWLLTHLRPGNAPFLALATALLLLLEQEMTETDRLIESRKLATALLL